MLKKSISEILYLKKKKFKKSRYKSNIAAAIAASLAASINFLALYSSGHGLTMNYGDTRFLVLLTVAVIIYVLKDRVKDLSKEYINNRIKSNEPYLYSQIMTRPIARIPEMSLGTINENVYYEKREKLDNVINFISQRADERATGSLVPNREVVCYEKKIMFNKKELPEVEGWSIKDIIRVDLKDFYCDLNEFGASVSFFDESDGKFESDEEKSYCMDLVVKYKDNSHTQFETYRIFLEKEGIIEIENTSKKMTYFYANKQSGGEKFVSG